MSVRRPAGRPLSWSERLESRTFLHAGHPEVIGGILTFVGTDANEVIEVGLTSSGLRYIVVFGEEFQTFPKAGITGVSIQGAGGRDRIRVRSDMAPLTVRVDGGDGNDSIRGSAGRETLLGGTGRDTLRGNGGNDRLEGGSSDDYLFAGSGHDRAYGGSGNDAIYGDAGNDKLFGQAGRDTMGGDDEDVLRFEDEAAPPDAAGNDLLDGGEDDDWLLGGLFTFSIADSNGRDTFTGGAGNDVLDARDANDSITDKAAGDYVPAQDFTPAREQQGDAHTHSFVRILVNVDGQYKQVAIPNNVGIFTQFGMAETHTHADDWIHYESPDHSGFALGEFFRNWGISLSPTNVGRYGAVTGQALVMRVKVGNQGAFQPVTTFGDFRPGDMDVVEIVVG